MIKQLMRLMMVIVLTTNVESKDLGKRGATFDIKEEDIVEFIKNRLEMLERAGALQGLQEKAIDKVKDRLRNPRAVSGVTNTKEEREFYYDPTYTVREDIKDHNGNILYRAGYALNPLASTSFGADMIFINGKDEKQLDWAKGYSNERGAKVILVRGSPLELGGGFDREIYFDQAGKLTSKLGITQVPAIVSQEKMKLKIRELKINDETDSH